MKPALCSILLALLAGCATVPPEHYRPPTQPYELLDAKLRTYLRDPGSAQQYAVGLLRQCNIGILGGKYCLCYEVNAKNAYGGYVGVQTFIAWYSPDGSRIDGVMEAAPMGPGEICIGKTKTPRDPKLIAGG